MSLTLFSSSRRKFSSIICLYVYILLIMKTVSSGLETVSYLGSKLWDISPLETKAVESLLEFKNKIRL